MNKQSEFSLVVDENCWRRSSVKQGSFVIEGAPYFAAFRSAVMNAERSVHILAWDLKEDIELVREGDVDDGYPVKLFDFLNAVLEAKPNLVIRILLWDYSMVYLAERDWLPLSKWKQLRHPRLIVEQDNALCLGASHHQKVVVIDGDFAFCGGIDLSAWRWDTQEHRVEDAHRMDPKGKPYQPYHDIHMAVAGEAAVDLDALFRMRWERAIGEVLEPIEIRRAADVWPASVDVDFEDVSIGIALTFSEYKDYEASRHIEQLHLDLIRSAERYIYIENQYLSSHLIVDALIERLREPEGPELVIVLTKDTGGFLEEGTLGLLRERLLEKLSDADAHNRFNVYYPYVEDESGAQSQVYVHAKLMICDDNTILSGSANLSNRSMKVDSEVAIVIKESGVFEPAKRLLRRLLAIHFHMDREVIDEELEGSGSISAVIKKLQKTQLHQLRDLEHDCGGPLRRKLADSQLLDPDEPIDPGHWVRKTIFDTNEASHSKKRKFIKYALLILCGIVAAYVVKQAWGSIIDPDRLDEFFEGLRGSTWLVPAMLSIYFVAGLIGMPINLLLVASTLTLGPWVTFLCGFFGSLLSAFAAFGIGNYGGRPIVEKLFDDKINDLSQQIANRGIFSVALIRVVPIAPFVVVNFVAGISKLKFRTFAIGSVIGMLPGMLGVVLVTHGAKNVFSDPSWETWALLIAVIILFVAGVFAVRKYKR